MHILISTPKTIPKTANYKEMPMESNVYGNESIRFLSDPPASYMKQSWSARFRPDYCTNLILVHAGPT
jgi:hypothetical protein